MVTTLNILGALAGFAAAWFWFQSAMLEPPSELKVSTGYGGPGTADTTPLVSFARASARLNKFAASLTGLAALLTGIATILQQAVR
jgi:hypothetical protein